MPPNFQRFLPIMLVALLLLFVVPSILHKKSSGSGQSAKSQSAQTLDAAALIDQAEQAYKAAQGRFTAHLSDIVSLRPQLGRDLADGVVVTLDAGTRGSSYLAQVESAYLSLVRARNGSKLVVSSCTVVKSASGVSCPAS